MPKVAAIPGNAIMKDKYRFDKEHNCVLAKVLVIVIATKPTGTLVNFSQVLDDMIGLDTNKKPFSFPWRPGDLLCWVCCYDMLCVLLLQLLMVFEEYNMVTTVAYNMFGLESEDNEVELVYPKPSLVEFLLDVVNTEENVQENETASADTPMVLLTLLSQAEVFFQGETILTVLLRLKLLPQDQPTLSVKGGAPNPYLVYLLPEDLVCRGPVGVTACYWCSELTLATRTW